MKVTIDCSCVLKKIIDSLLEGTKIMSSVTDLQNAITDVAALGIEISGAVTATATIVGTIDTKLDEIKVFIESIKNGQVVTPAELDEAVGKLNAIKNDAGVLKAAAEALKAAAEGVYAETDALDAA